MPELLGVKAYAAIVAARDQIHLVLFALSSVALFWIHAAGSFHKRARLVALAVAILAFYGSLGAGAIPGILHR